MTEKTTVGKVLMATICYIYHRTVDRIEGRGLNLTSNIHYHLLTRNLNRVPK